MSGNNHWSVIVTSIPGKNISDDEIWSCTRYSDWAKQEDAQYDAENISRTGLRSRVIPTDEARQLEAFDRAFIRRKESSEYVECRKLHRSGRYIVMVGGAPRYELLKIFASVDTTAMWILRPAGADKRNRRIHMDLTRQEGLFRTKRAALAHVREVYRP